MCNKEDAKKRIDAIIEQIPDFWEYVFVEPSLLLPEEWGTVDEEINSIETLMRYGTHPSNICWSMGCSKIVIWDEENPDYVLKMGIADSDEAYCAKEYSNYLYAEKKGAAKAFAWMERIYSGEVRNIYAMEYIDCNEELISHNSYNHGFSTYCSDLGYEEDDPKVQLMYSDYYCCSCEDENIILMEYAMDSWSDELADRVTEVIHDREINDLHSGNMGYRNGQVVLVDYSGWWSD